MPDRSPADEAPRPATPIPGFPGGPGPDLGRRGFLGAGALALAAASGLAPRPAGGQAGQVIRTEKQAVRVVTVVGGLDHPWSVAFLPDGDLLVTERPGRLRLVRNGKLESQPVAGLPEIAAQGQGGLLDVALHPRYAENAWLYLSYAARGPGGVGTEVLRGRLRGLRLTDATTIFRLEPKTGSGQHFGCRLVFDRAGHLFVTLGDRGERGQAQRLDDIRGKVLRLHDDGRIPADNPFVNQAGARGEVFTYGNRNVQGAALHPETGALWAHEHGPQGGDEVNVLKAGGNYGWPVITFGKEYGSGRTIGEGTARADVVAPLHVWVPSIAPSGMAFYTGTALPGWRGSLFVGALVPRLLVRLEIAGEKVVHEERMLNGTLGRLRDVRMGPDGFLYLLSDESPGVLARLEPAQR